VSGRFDRIIGHLDVAKIRCTACGTPAAPSSLSNDAPVHLVAARLRHDPAILLKLYTHVPPDSGPTLPPNRLGPVRRLARVGGVVQNRQITSSSPTSRSRSFLARSKTSAFSTLLMMRRSCPGSAPPGRTLRRRGRPRTPTSPAPAGAWRCAECDERLGLVGHAEILAPGPGHGGRARRTDQVVPHSARVVAALESAVCVPDRPPIRPFRTACLTGGQCFRGVQPWRPANVV
jgi:hypothetical protein